MENLTFSYMSYYCLEGHIFCAWVNRTNKYNSCPECQSKFKEIVEVIAPENS